MRVLHRHHSSGGRPHKGLLSDGCLRSALGERLLPYRGDYVLLIPHVRLVSSNSSPLKSCHKAAFNLFRSVIPFARDAAEDRVFDAYRFNTPVFTGGSLRSVLSPTNSASILSESRFLLFRNSP